VGNALELYYVGDLCYLLKDDWNEICGCVQPMNDKIVFTLQSGLVIGFVSINDYHLDSDSGRRYSSDSGSIGIVKLKDLSEELQQKAKEVEAEGLAHCIELSDFSIENCINVGPGGLYLGEGFDGDFPYPPELDEGRLL